MEYIFIIIIVMAVIIAIGVFLYLQNNIIDITKKTPYTVKCTAVLIYTILYVKSEKNNISVFYDIFLSFGTDKSLFSCGIV